MNKSDFKSNLSLELSNDEKEIVDSMNYISSLYNESKEPVKIIDRSFGKNVAYCAFYKNILYAISEYKERVVHYMEENRYCLNYEIRIYDLDHIALIGNPELFLYKFNGVYITERDIIMIEMNLTPIADEIDDTYDKLYSLVKKIGQSGKKKKTISKLIDALNALTTLKLDSKFMEELEEINGLDNSIIYCPIDKYNNYLKEYEEYFNAYNRWFYKD